MAEPTWSWGGLMRGDPYGQGAPGKPMPGAPGPSPQFGSSAQFPLRTPGGQPGQWFGGSRAGQFGFPQPAQIPSDIEAIRGRLKEYQDLPSGMLTPEHKQYQNYWQGVFNMPEAEDFNVGPQMASLPLGEGAGPSSPWAGWQPAQEEGWSA